MTEELNAQAEREILRKQYEAFMDTVKRNHNPRSNTALIIDDERGIRMKVARDAKAFDPNLVIFEAANGREGLDKLAHIRKSYLRDPLFIVLDLNMPIMDGWEVIAKLKEDYEGKGRLSGIPVIVLSSTSGERGLIFGKKSVHGGKTGYVPLVTVAKETCVDQKRYDAKGETGLMNWLEYFLKRKQ